MFSSSALFSASCIALLYSLQPLHADTIPSTGTQKSSAFTPEQQQELQLMFGRFVKTNPEMIKSTLEKFIAAEAAEQERKEKVLAAQRIQAHEKAIFQNLENPFLGNPSGDRIIAVFVDPYCGYCRKSIEDLEKLAEKDNEVKVIIHDIAILGEESEIAVKGLLTAKALGKYDAFRNALKKVDQPLNHEGLKKIAVSVGIDGTAFTATLSQNATLKNFQASQKLAGDLKLDAAPTLVYNRELLQGYVPLEALQKRLGFLVTLQETPPRDEG